MFRNPGALAFSGGFHTDVEDRLDDSIAVVGFASNVAVDLARLSGEAGFEARRK